MTGTVEHPKRTAQAEVSSLVKAEDILTPEELAARLKVPDSWVYEKTRGRFRNPIPCLRLGRYVRFDWTVVATWLTAPTPQETGRQGRIFRAAGKRPARSHQDRLEVDGRTTIPP